MVKLRFSAERLVEVSGFEIDVLRDSLFRLKCETEESGGFVEVEVNPDRPDMFSAEGIGRAVRGLMSVELGWSPPNLVDTGISILNEFPQSRPIIAGAVVYDVKVDEPFLQELIQFQEKLHETLGRRRRKVAIGLHDLSKVRGEKLTYTLVDLDTTMEPLGVGKKVTVRETLRITEQGAKYGGLSLVEKDGRVLHPAILDGGGKIVSLPPVINSENTKVEAGTRDLFIDVTGTDEQAVNQVLGVLVLNLVERRGARLGYVTLLGRDSPTKVSPSLDTRRQKVNVNYVNRVLGTDLTIDEASLALLRMRHAVDPLALSEGELVALVPPFRVDVIGLIDLVEDIAIAIGYDSPMLSPAEPPVMPTGSLTVMTRLARRSRDLMIGLGFTELLSYLLTSYNLLEVMGIADQAVRVKNPVQADLDALRPSLVPSLLTAMAYNVMKKKPVRLFEIGKVAIRRVNDVEEERRLGAGLMDDAVGYEDVQAVAYSYLRSLGLSPSATPLAETRFLLEGRAAELLADGRPVGIIGEVRPVVLERLNIDYPVAVFEISLDRVLEAISGGAAGQTA